jgi:hypothetical protein
MTKANGETHGFHARNNLLPLPQPATELGPIQLPRTTVAPTREFESAVLSDGRIVDLIGCTRAQDLEFLVWQDGQIHRASSIEHDNQRMIVPKLDATVISALRLPTAVKACPPVSEMFLQLMEQIEMCVDVSKEHSFLIAAFIVSTWFADRLSIVPYLAVCGPLDSGRTKLLRLLHCLCRRAIHVGDVTPVSLYRLSAQVLPTWLIDEPDFSNRHFQRLLRGGNQRGSHVLSNGKAFENFGPKVIASRTPLDDTLLASNTVHIVMAPSSRDLITLDGEAQQKLADTFQPVLQMFRLVHYRAVSVSRYPGFLKFPAGLRDSARLLAAPMLRNEELLERLAAALESQVHSMQFDRFSQPEWIVMRALYALYHEANGDLYVSDVTDECNRILRGSGETRLYSAKKVGAILNRSLGFLTRRRGEGYRIELTLPIVRLIHSQAKAMGINRADMLHSISVESGLAGQPCDFCSEFELMKDHDGRRLRDFSDPDFVVTLPMQPASEGSA